MKTNFFKFFSILGLIFTSQLALAKTEPKCAICTMDNYMYFISLSPIVLFILLIILIFWKLQLEEYKIGDSLKENQTIDISIPNPEYVAPTPIPQAKPVQNGTNPVATDSPVAASVPSENTPPPFVGKTIQPQSASRLLAFISGIITLALSSCLSSFWLFRYFGYGEGPDLNGLTYVLLSLGLGIVPYAVNKITTPSKP